MRRLLMILSLGLWAAAPLAAAETGAAGLEVKPAEWTNVPRMRLLDGTVEAVTQATLTAETSGRIRELNFDVDDYVEEGDVILRFRDESQRAQLSQARASLTEAQARFEEARSEYRRVKDIFERDLVSRSQMDRAEAALDSARARLEAARAQVEEAEEQLSYTVVRAPFSGIVTERHVEEGEAANVGQKLISGLSLEEMRVVVHVPQRFIDPVRERRKARVLVSEPGAGATNGEAREIDAESLTFYPYADPTTHSFRVRVNLPKGTEGLFPGMFVKVAFDLGTDRRLTVPAEAVAHRSEVTAVYVVDAEGKVHMRHVRLGHRIDGRVVILAGLEDGEQVAVDPVRAGVVAREQFRREAEQGAAGEHG